MASLRCWRRRDGGRAAAAGPRRPGSAGRRLPMPAGRRPPATRYGVERWTAACAHPRPSAPMATWCMLDADAGRHAGVALAGGHPGARRRPAHASGRRHGAEGLPMFDLPRQAVPFLERQLMRLARTRSGRLAAGGHAVLRVGPGAAGRHAAGQRLHGPRALDRGARRGHHAGTWQAEQRDLRPTSCAPSATRRPPWCRR
jgi:hypothetical protein